MATGMTPAHDAKMRLALRGLTEAWRREWQDRITAMQARIEADCRAGAGGVGVTMTAAEIDRIVDDCKAMAHQQMDALTLSLTREAIRYAKDCLLVGLLIGAIVGVLVTLAVVYGG